MKGRTGYWVSFNQDADSLVRMKEHASRSITKVHEQPCFVILRVSSWIVPRKLIHYRRAGISLYRFKLQQICSTDANKSFLAKSQSYVL